MINTTEKTEDSKAISMAKSIINQGINGFMSFSGAVELAKTYEQSNYIDIDAKVNALINWESSKNFTSGFLTGLGGLITLPISIPASLGASWVIQARMCAVIAKFYGYELNDERVQVLILLSIMGDAGKEILKEAGIKVGNDIAFQLSKNFTPQIIKEINKQIGFRLITNSSQKTITQNIIKFIPFVGGAIGGTFDAVSCQIVGKSTKAIFSGK